MGRKRFLFTQTLSGFCGVTALICFSLVLLPFLAFGAEDPVCARVKLEIKQELTLERQAFDAHMRITNGLTHITLENVRVDISFSDEAGNSVVASSDPGNTDALFFIRLDTQENISNLDGTGSVDPASTADIHWLIIPATGASNGVPHGTLYYVGARLTYTVGGEENITEVAPDYIFVKPMPQITIDYFLPADVYGDDAFTPQIEPPVPFSLGVRLTNNGSGVATGMKINSAQPRIKENDQGLLIGFVIEGSEVNGLPRTPNLLVDFGDIAPDTSAVARWVMTCTLSGEFVEFSADYSHSDELGGELTSLLEAVNTHVLVRDVLVDVAGRDPVRDFLAREGGGYRVYESENVDTVVVDQSDGSILNGATLTTPPTEGFMYVKLLDPHNGQMELRDLLRSDGKRIKPENAWLSKTRNGEGWDYFLNLFDVNTTGSYTLAFAGAAAQNSRPVLQFIEDRTVVEGEAFSFQVTATDEDGTIPALEAKRLPAQAGFSDQHDGTGTFQWTPTVGQAGLFEITFTASDGLLADSRSAVIIVNPIGDRDGDGMLDVWEIANFGDLSHDGRADSDGDGISDLDEFLQGTDPRSSNAPTVPVISSPKDKTEVRGLLPDLVVLNSSDPDGDDLFYTFELYSDEGMTTLISSLSDVTQGVETTPWNVSVSLTDNTWYFWRVRATDGRGSSSWAYGSFFVNTENDPPGSFEISSPDDGSEVSSQTPLLEVTNSVDVDGDVVTYSFEVYLDPTAPPVVVSGGIPEGPDGTSQWTVNIALYDNTLYYWRAVAMDEHGARNETELVSFFVNLANDAPGEPQILSPVTGSEVVFQELDLVVTNAIDVDWDVLTYSFELDKVNTFDSGSLLASGEVSEGQDRTSWHLSALDDNSTYFWRVKASDGFAESQWVQGNFFVNSVNDNPSVPGLKNPGVGAWVDTLTPKLELHASQDLDNDPLTYRFEVYDQLWGTLVAEGESEIPEWVVPPGLADNVWYYWRAEAKDEHGAKSGWMATVSFFTDSNGVDDPPVIEIQEPSQDLFTNGESILIRWLDDDPDSNAEIALDYNTNPSGGGSTPIVEGLKEDPDGQGDSYPWDISGIGEGTYYVHAMISDGNSSSGSSTHWAITIDRTAPTLQASPPGGTYMSARIVALSSDEPADIYYTLDGSGPTLESPKYSSSIEIPETATLTFMALDKAGNRSEPVTEIYTIRAEGRSLIESAIEVLEENLDRGDKWLYKRIVKAIKPLKKSLDDRYWETDNLLTRKGEKVFEEGKKAVKELEKILNRKNKKKYMGGARDAALEAVDLLIQAYETLAFEEIKQALDTAHSAGCCYDEECVDVSRHRECREAVKDIAKARKEMERALKEYDRGRFDKAVDHYKEAREEARDAVEELFDHENDDDSDSDDKHKDKDDDSDSDDKHKDKDDDSDSDDKHRDKDDD